MNPSESAPAGRRVSNNRIQGVAPSLRRAVIPGFVLVLLSPAAASGLRAQGWWGEGGQVGEEVRTAREIPSHSTDTPNWENPRRFRHDVFTFVRIRYDRGNFGYGRSRGGWRTDLPDSDLNLSYRLQQMTSVKVDPDGRIIRLTDPELADYPFIYIVEPGGLYLNESEVRALRKYLLNGGFLMLDDFWGEREWASMEHELRKVFPDRSFTDIPLSHPVYHCVFEIKSKAQVPNIYTGVQSQVTGVTWEREDAQVVHHRGLFDDKGRLMAIATHNTDNGDGWEREGENDYYFHTFSEKIAYPLGINIIFYAMTH
ncbi:MAG: DUF4159 domain-containing protein [Opitutaceae bacterium]|nr:DUF4159 domain-containing protein [Opitutaceae bacterium]